ncbi:H-NS histone family protein [Caballeronia concitans]|uniref:Histone family protein nucleoid-structuring protein H-NS n=1 Tax=Caballeronia concitans TaxID=1777133 RepID=A0A658R5G0_9BURK|nr:H-NS family nucleoid-associated regulatory protein [Caballeronia concitans]SAL52333.1 histone family protein nucleoid-structuring protein H-NS [Caballeronia concitans]
MSTLKALKAKIAKLQAQADEIRRSEAAICLQKIRDLMERHGLTPEDIAESFRESPTTKQPIPAKKTRAVTKPPALRTGPAKYRDPKTGRTWTGRGRAPLWIADAEDRSAFLMKQPSVTKPGTERKPKASDGVRGSQKPRYQDPKSGSTWNGRGRVPFWLSAVTDRTDFLIKNANLLPGTTNLAPALEIAKNTEAEELHAEAIVLADSSLESKAAGGADQHIEATLALA